MDWLELKSKDPIRLAVLSAGELLAEGTPAQIQQNDEVNRAYMGEEG